MRGLALHHVRSNFQVINSRNTIFDTLRDEESEEFAMVVAFEGTFTDPSGRAHINQSSSQCRELCQSLTQIASLMECRGMME